MAASTESMRVKPASPSGRFFAFGLLGALAAAVLWAMGASYRAGDTIGYNLGLAGGVAMLVLLLYPVAKRVRVLQRLLALRFWFRWHMILGVAGPVLIMLHARFSFGSINGTVAFAAMMVVFLSGLIGRFVYAKIHKGLYGRKLTLAEAKARFGLSGENTRSKLRSFPEIEADLRALEERLLHTAERASALWRLLSVAVAARLGYLRLSRRFQRALALAAARRGLDASTHARARRQGKRLLRAYVRAIEDVAQFAAYERLFALWHLLHVPLMVILLFSGVIHVVAVHMY